MIYFKFRIGNSNKSVAIFNSWYKEIPFERSVEISYGKISSDILSIGLSTKLSGSDHAGPSFEISIFGYGIDISFPKGRHWDYKKNQWMEKYEVWMENVLNLAREKHPDYDWYETDFLEYYNGGLTPEEALKEYEEVYLEDEEIISIQEYFILISTKINKITKDINLDISEIKDYYDENTDPETVVDHILLRYDV